MLFPELAMEKAISKHGLDPSKVEKIYYLKDLSKDGLYMAFSKGSDKKIIDKFRKSSVKVHKSGIYEKIKKKYVK